MSGEEVYNPDFQRFLYLEGNYVTHAEPRSASGEADIIGEADSDDALICDGKIFDAASRSKNYLAKGYNQIVQYAQDYQKNVATWSFSSSPADRSSSRLTRPRACRSPTSTCPASGCTWSGSGRHRRRRRQASWARPPRW